MKSRRVKKLAAIYFNSLEIWEYAYYIAAMPRPFHHPAPKDITLDGVLHALSDPIRRQIVTALAGCEGMRCNKTCDVMPPSTLSFHCKVLRDAGLIRSEKKGVEVINMLRKKDIDKRFPGVLDAILDNHES